MSESTIKIGSGTVGQNEVRHFEFEAAEISGYPLRIPVTVVNGAKSGPTLCVTSGLHGGEYDSIEAALRLSNAVFPGRLSGKLIVLPIINIQSFLQKVPFTNPIDNVNMNRIFPGDPRGSVSRRMANKIFSEIVLRSNFLIDLHGGDLTESIQAHVMVKITGNKDIDDQSRKMAEAFDIPYVWELEVSGIPDYPGYPKGTVTYEAPSRGIPSVTAEAGERGKLEEESVKVLYEGMVNVMKQLKMIDGALSPTRKKTLLQHGAVVCPNIGGLFYPNVSCGDHVDIGTKLGVVKNLRGEVKETLSSKTKGVVLSLTPLMPVSTGEFVILIVEL